MKKVWVWGRFGDEKDPEMKLVGDEGGRMTRCVGISGREGDEARGTKRIAVQFRGDFDRRTKGWSSV
jgi:hypothetical protein